MARPTHLLYGPQAAAEAGRLKGRVLTTLDASLLEECCSLVLCGDETGYGPDADALEKRALLRSVTIVKLMFVDEVPTVESVKLPDWIKKDGRQRK